VRSVAVLVPGDIDWAEDAVAEFATALQRWRR
jgi:hypothetical protein